MELSESWKEFKENLMLHLSRLTTAMDKLEGKVDKLAEGVIISIEDRKAIHLEINELKDITKTLSKLVPTNGDKNNWTSVIQNPYLILAVLFVLVLLILSDKVGSTSVKEVISDKLPKLSLPIGD